MVAYGLTKALGPERLRKLVKMMGMKEWKDKRTKMDARETRCSSKDEIVAEFQPLHLRDHQSEEWE
jgi:hypothetical protein